MKVDKKNNSIAAQFRAARQQLGFTQQVLADHLLLTRNYVAKIEAGIQEPSPRTVMALENLRVSLVNNYETPVYGTGEAATPDTRDTPQLVRALRAEFEALLAASGHLPQRLHWIAEQMKEHLSVPRSWSAAQTKGVHVTLPSQSVALSAETGKPVPASSRPARSA